jgi:hypothetical protein
MVVSAIAALANSQAAAIRLGRMASGTAARALVLRPLNIAARNDFDSAHSNFNFAFQRNL